MTAVQVQENSNTVIVETIGNSTGLTTLQGQVQLSVDTTRDASSGNFTATVNTVYGIDLSANGPLGADVAVTLPSGNNNGDKISVCLTGADASYGLDYVGTIGSVSYSGGQLKITSAGDHVNFVWYGATIGWLVQ